MLNSKIFIAAAAITFALTSPHVALAQATGPLEGGVTIVIPLDAIGASRDSSLKAMQAVVAVVRKQPGLVTDVLLSNKSSAATPSHVHVTHWRDQRSWELMFTDAEFLKILRANSAFLSVADSAGVYVPAK